MDAGRSISCTLSVFPSRWSSMLAAAATGTRCVPCVSCVGTATPGAGPPDPRNRSHLRESRATYDPAVKPELETEYLQVRWCETRLLIRVASVLSALVALLRGADKVYGGTWDLRSLS